ncbi:MAG: pyridoxamine 5'-phosphate oxidase family protein [Bacteroidetes bacterium]|nr:pyridoxamine 5'-phosphate oxidase family protein [Bacteroidota bacterium]
MRRTERKIEDENIINKILSESIVCRIGLFDEEYPYVIPLNYGYKNNALYIHCAGEGKKIDLIRKNNKACFEIEESYQILEDEVSCNWTTKYRSVIGTGDIEIITDFDEKGKGLDVIMNQHGKMENTYSDKLVNRVVILKLNITSVSGKQS